MPPNTKYAILGYAVAGLNAYSLSYLLSGSVIRGGTLPLVVMGLTLASWFYWMHRFGLYDNIPEGETVID